MRPLDPGALQEQERRDRAAAKAADDQLRSDIRAMMQMAPARRTLWRFMQQMGIDGSAFSTNAMTQSRSIGLQDGARWWLNVIREYCPEQEAAMRAEARRAIPVPSGDEDEPE